MTLFTSCGYDFRIRLSSTLSPLLGPNSLGTLLD